MLSSRSRRVTSAPPKRATASGSKFAKARRKESRLARMVRHESPAWKASRLKRSNSARSSSAGKPHSSSWYRSKTGSPSPKQRRAGLIAVAPARPPQDACRRAARGSAAVAAGRQWSTRRSLSGLPAWAVSNVCREGSVARRQTATPVSRARAAWRRGRGASPPRSRCRPSRRTAACRPSSSRRAGRPSPSCCPLDRCTRR